MIETRTYDPLGRLGSVTDVNGATVGYSYDAASQKTGLIYSDQREAAYTYDAAGRLASVTDVAGEETTYTYRTDGLPLTVTRPNGVSTAYTYDAAGRLTGVAHGLGATTLLSLDYTLDAVGNPTQVVDSRLGTTGYVYDGLDRLVSETNASGTISYTFDPGGNRLTKSVGAVVTNYSYDAADQLTGTDDTSYTHDANGSRLTSTDASATTSYSWSEVNLLESVTSSAVSTENTYDGLGRRVACSVSGVETAFVLDDPGTGDSIENVLEDTIGSDTSVYTYGLGVVSKEQGSGTCFYLTDAVGSVRLLTDESGAIVGEYEYDAFGVPALATGGSGNAFTYAGQWNEPSGLDFMRARVYEPTTGRFLSKDPLPGSAKDPRSLNPYVYVMNRPLVLTDPSGEFGLSTAWNVLSWGKKGAGLASGAADYYYYTKTEDNSAMRSLRFIEDFSKFVPGMVGGIKGHPITENAYIQAYSQLSGPNADAYMNSLAFGSGCRAYTQRAASAGRAATYTRVVPPSVAPYTYGQRNSQVFAK